MTACRAIAAIVGAYCLSSFALVAYFLRDLTGGRS